MFMPGRNIQFGGDIMLESITSLSFHSRVGFWCRSLDNVLNFVVFVLYLFEKQ